MRDVTLWVVIFLLGLLGLNWPILEVFRENPYGYLLSFWLFYVVILARTARGDKAPPPR